MTVHGLISYFLLCRKALTNAFEFKVVIKDLGEEEWTDVWQYVAIQYSALQCMY